MEQHLVTTADTHHTKHPNPSVLVNMTPHMAHGLDVYIFRLVVDPDDALLGDAQQARLQLVLALDLLLRESEHT